MSIPVRFKEHSESILSQLSRENKNVFLIGDLNLNLLNCENHSESNDFLLMLNSYFLLPYILQPTCITKRSATLINNIFANATSGNLVLRISDHLPQFLIVDNVRVNYKTLNYYKNNYSKFDEEKFINDFSLLNWANILNDLDVNIKFDGFFINCHNVIITQEALKA